MSISKQEWADLAYIDKHYSKFNWKGWRMCGFNPTDVRHMSCVYGRKGQKGFCVDSNELFKIHERHPDKKRARKRKS